MRYVPNTGAFDVSRADGVSTLMKDNLPVKADGPLRMLTLAEELISKQGNEQDVDNETVCM